MKKRITQGLALLALLTTTWLMFSIQSARSAAAPFNVVEATIDGIQKAYKDGTLTAHQLTQMYLDRINAFDKNGPTINSVITLNAKALEEADRLDGAMIEVLLALTLIVRLCEALAPLLSVTVSLAL